MVLALEDSISFRELPTTNDPKVLSAEVNINNLNFVICLTYRPSTTWNNMKHHNMIVILLLLIQQFNKSIIIIGDLIKLP